MKQSSIILKGVNVNNLKNIDLSLPHNQLIVITGVSGSGKSSLAFDTIYTEGQRRYVESLPAMTRRHLTDLPKPDVKLISGISPTIAIEQKSRGNNPRSIVATMTGILDFLRVLYARLATGYCPISSEPVTPQSLEQIASAISTFPKETKLILLAPHIREKKGELKEDIAQLIKQGFTKARLDGELIDLSEQIAIDGTVNHTLEIVIDRLIIGKTSPSRLKEAVQLALDEGQGLLIALNLTNNEEQLFSRLAFSPKSGKSYPPLEARDFSFNHPLGMCPTCQGLGITEEFDLDKIIDPNKSIAEDCCSIASSYNTVRYGNIYNNLARLHNFEVSTPWKDLSKRAKKIFLYGTVKKWTRMRFVHPHKKMQWNDYIQWRGVLHEARKRYEEASSELYKNKMHELMIKAPCHACHGERIKPYPAAARFHKMRLPELLALPISESLNFFQNLKLTKLEKKIAEQLLSEITQRLSYLSAVGLNYLSLERSSPTLSGGESQRVRLASLLGAGLVNATYVLDEPSIGLHSRDHAKLIATLERLRDQGNTVIVVEHDADTMLAADQIIDIGPGAGRLGGEVVAQGTLSEIINNPLSLTGAYLSGKIQTPRPKVRRKKGKKNLTLTGCSHHNLKKITVEFPLGLFVGISGVSGSGKSSLIDEILSPLLANKLQKARKSVGKHEELLGIEHVDKVIAIDQSPIGRTPRSNPATYIKAFDEIRNLFSMLPESEAKGFKPGRFSFNVKEGSCLSCSGMGMIKLDLDVMEDEWIPCEECRGKRFDRETLSIHYKGKTIADILAMTIEEALPFFEALEPIKRKLLLLDQVGLGYLQLGQASPTLSGGEAQRIKLAKELSKKERGHTIYILDEPTTGLHFDDVAKLLTILQKLVDRGHSLFVIEHNLDLLQAADWLLELGPDAGELGGELIAVGTPEKIAKLNTPTGLALNAYLKKTSGKKVSLQKAEPIKEISVRGARQNNLKNLNVDFPLGKITVCTGPSGSGKSSFAFETIYAEGQRRYSESLSSYLRQFIKQMAPPLIDSVTGLSPAIAIEQKAHAGNPRSTVGTMTESYDFLRLIYAYLGTAFCPETGEKIEAITLEFVLKQIMKLPEKTKIQILAPLTLPKSESFQELCNHLRRLGYLRLRLNGKDHLLEEDIPFNKGRKNDIALIIDRLVIKPHIEKRLHEALAQAVDLSDGKILIDKQDEELFYNLAFAVKSTGKSYPPITPHTFSFNHEKGMCPSCLGIGSQYGAKLTHFPELMKLTSYQLIDLLWKDYAHTAALDLFFIFLDESNIDPDTPLSELDTYQLDLILNGSEKSFSFGQKNANARWLGISSALSNFVKMGGSALREHLLPLLDQFTCPSCKGSRLNPLARNVKIADTSISDFCELPIDEAHDFLLTLDLSEHSYLVEAFDQLKNRLHFLKEIGLSYLSLARSAPTLSGGESQRIRLSRQLGSGLTGCLYILDEPTIGLHPRDTTMLNNALRSLRDLGNTLLLVEHDPLTMKIADHIIDFGPKAGDQGGELCAQGTLEEIKNNPHSLTGLYLSGKKSITLPSKARTSETHLTIKNAAINNLKNIDVNIPLNTLTGITGVSGSGKSSLMGDLLQPALQMHFASRSKSDTISYCNAEISGLSQIDKQIYIAQNPLGGTSRADIATYTDLSTHIRSLYASMGLSKVKGLQPRHFSHNHKKGMCLTCQGLGKQKIELQYLPPVSVTCETCKGKRLNPISLEVLYREKNLGEASNLSILEARAFFTAIPKIVRILDTLISVGLGYLQLNREIASLSGGEAQRIRLSRELAKRARGHTLYLFDEPTIGLHSDDIATLIPIFHQLVDKGHSVIIIEHNLDLIAQCDHLIDLGPESGAHGGMIVATGTPQKLSKSPKSLTGKYLKPILLK